MQLDLLSGLMSDQSGQDHLHVNRFQLPENKEEKRIKDTSGLSGSISSESLDLQSFLENKLAQQLTKDGWTKSKVIWNPVTTLQGRSLFRLHVSVLITSGTDCGSWPTPIYSDWRGSAGKEKNELPNIAKMAHWPTPAARDHKGARKLNSEGKSQSYKTGITYGRTLDQAPQLLELTSGGAARQCDAKTENLGSYQLNPRFSLWLMGYPTEWASCGEQVTQLSLKSLQK